MMDINRIEKKTTLYIVLVFLSFAQIIFECLEQKQITTIMFYVSFILLLYLWLGFREGNQSKYDRRIIIIAVLCFVNVLIEIFIDGGSFSFDTVKKIIFFVSCLVIYRVSLDTVNAERLHKWFSLFALLCSAFFIFMYFTNNALMYTRANVGVSQYLTLNLENPNKASLFISVILFANVGSFFTNRSLIRKIAILGCIGFFVYFLIETGSRGGELTVLVFGIVMLLFLRERVTHVPKFVCFLIAIIPFVFSRLYLAFIDSILLSGKLDFLIYDGKGLDSRVAIWEKAFSVIRSHWLTGGYSLFTYQDTGLYQLHNTHLDVFGSFGVIVFILYVIFLYTILHDLSENDTMELPNYYYFIAFAFTIILGSSEAAAVNGTNGLPILMATFIALSKNYKGT